MISINTNPAATAAAYNLGNINTSLQKSLQRLSSGSRINSSYDDAGGLAVSMKLSASIRRTEATQANVSNSLAFLETQDGVLKSADKVISRMSELAQLATDVTKSSSDIALYNTEYSQLKRQLTSLSNEAFNGISLFSTLTTGSSLTIVASQDGSQTIGVTQAALSGNPFMNMIINGYEKFVIGGETFIARKDISATSMQGSTSSTGVSVYSLSSGKEYLMNTNGTYTSVPGTVPAAPGNPPGTYVTQQIVPLRIYDKGNGSLYASGSITPTYTLTGQSTSAAPSINVSLNDLLGNGTYESSIPQSSLNQNTALDNASLMQLAIQASATFRANNGSEQSRMNFAADVLAINKTNLESANSRIIDVDVAEESSKLARFNILQQAGTAMLAQANQSTQSILRLLM